MPEGHTIHRYARLHSKSLTGKQARVTSPQGRFAAGAARLDGAAVDDVEAHGKHLFYRWDNGETLHVHLGLFGRFRTFNGAPPPPTDGTRLAIGADDVTLYLAGPTMCRLIDEADEQDLRRRLGPDPLDRTADGAEFAANLQRRRIPISAALLDQKVIAGIGNVYRAELLFLAGVSPFRPAFEVGADVVEAVWMSTREHLRRGERSGRIVTVDPAEIGASSRAKLKRRERLYVYKRDGLPCRRCGTEITIGESGNRKIWWCRRCQPD